MHKERIGIAICATPLILLVILRLTMDFNGLYGQDAHEYQRYAEELSQYLKGGSAPGPFFWPVNYPLLGSLINPLLGSVNLALQCLSAGSTLIFLFVMMVSVRKDAGHPALVLLPLCLYATIPAVIRSSVVIMSEATMLAFLTLALWYYQKNKLGESRFRNLLLVVLSGLLAVGTRYVVIVLVLPLISFALWQQRKNLSARNMVTTLAVVALAILPNFLLKTNFSWGLLHHDLLERWSLDHFLSLQFVTANGMVENTFPNLCYYGVGIFHFKYLWWSAPLFVFKRKWSKTEIFFGILGVIYIVFMSGIPEQNSRYLMPLVPIVIYLVDQPLRRLLLTAKYRSSLFFLFISVLLGQIYFSSSEVKVLIEQQRLEKRMAEKVCQADARQLYTFAIDQALGSYGCQLEIINLWSKKVENFELNALALFNESLFGQQWEDENPMINWKQLEQTHELKLIQDFGRGWQLFRIGQKK